MTTHAKKEKNTTNKQKKKQNKGKTEAPKNLLNLIPIHWSNPLSSPYQALIKPLSSPYSDLTEIVFNCYPVGCFKTPKKEKQNPIQT